MKKDYLVYTLIYTVSLLISSCSQTEEQPRGDFASGVVVVNEGNFSEANGSISFYNENNQEVSQDLFALANGIKVGGLLQSVYYFENKAFIIDNLGSKIYVVDAETYEHIHTIEDGLSTPRHMIVNNGKAYVTNWGPYDANFNLPNSFVSVIDLVTFEQTSSIATDSGCEGLIVYGGKVCVANSFSNTVDIIDQERLSVVGQIEVEWGPQSFQEDENGTVWLLSSAFIGPSYLSVIDLAAEQIVKTIRLADYSKSLNINGSGDVLYYLSAPFGSDTEVYRLPIDATVASSEPIVSAANIYGLGVHPASGELFLANHNGFQGNGTVLIYEGSTLKSSFASGVGPNGFVFR